MNLKYFRIAVFHRLMRPFSAHARRGRMEVFAELIHAKEGMAVLDLGGTSGIWATLPIAMEITILNLPGTEHLNAVSHHRFKYVEGDACQVTEYQDRQFDIVFSNSVIEHVGAVDRQAAFAEGVRRLGKSYWVQTPSKWFPIEAHCGMPFWWFYPGFLRKYFIERWRKKLPAWTQMVEETRVLTKADLQRYFPEATIYVETYFGIPKSYVAYSPATFP